MEMVTAATQEANDEKITFKIKIYSTRKKSDHMWLSNLNLIHHMLFMLMIILITYHEAPSHNLRNGVL